jgi:hypothetical protein
MTQHQSSKGSQRPGAMKMAMAAARTASGPKVLRIGIIQGTKMTEERIIRERDTVTVGRSEKNSFTVSAQDLPETFELFPMSGGAYSLRFTDRMEGRLALAAGVKSLDDLRKSGEAKRVGSDWQIPLTEQSRGKVQVGEITFLFQFVVPPPAQPKPQLPAAIRAGWLKNIDWTYNACFSFFLLMTIVGVAYVEYVYDPIVDENILNDSAFVRLVSQPAAPEEPPPPEQSAEASQEPSTQQAAAQPHQQTHAAAPSAEQQRARTERQANAATASAERAANAALAALQNNAEFAALTGVTDTGRGSARDALASGGLMAGTERDLANLGGITTAAGGAGVRRSGLSASAGGGLGGRQLGAAGAVAGGGENIGSGGEVVRERVIRGSADLGSGDSIGGEGNIDAGRVASLIRGQLGGIRSCYERALRNNPTLSGRLEVRFTIGAAGRVTSASSSGLSAAPEVGTCVASRIRGLVFPQPEGGSVDFSFPFTFAPGS